ncbi:MAG: hypothetical protein CVU32_00520 [Betaproteobacteria bacterium HGW-Betaproteobacteria-5]|jgi:hypothetical protein|nr:MAG: hypothetical protein CVU32_00520 [Betaproteobacteria bacterium HGW-Betaproteobacteria-5]PKO41141.1 MAG: hypothetical protein CVU33_01115 [Betaproteobacteria bacterium HGW-Betaproteobacteria-6]
MERQRFAIKGCEFEEEDPQLQAALADAYDTLVRPRCLCVPGGIEMYVARHSNFVVKRMPGSGSAHHPACPSYDPEPQQSGLGELMGEAVLEPEPGKVELRVDFPWSRKLGRSVPRAESREVREVDVPRLRMSLRALAHFLFERAGFNRWTPAMFGKRNQGVLCKYLMEAAVGIMVKGVPLVDRLYVPEPFSESSKVGVAQRRHEKLAVLSLREEEASLAVVIGEYKANEATMLGRRVWIRHMPDTPLLITSRSWDRIERVFAPLFEARDADLGRPTRLIMTSLIRARREYTYEIDTVSLMLLSEHWIPVEGVHELPLIDALVAQRRHFIKPLRYDARSVAGFPNALLLDAGPSIIPLHIVSPFLDAKERAAKEKAIKRGGDATWVWSTEQPMPSLKCVAGSP